MLICSMWMNTAAEANYAAYTVERERITDSVL